MPEAKRWYRTSERPVNRVAYRLVKRQSQQDPNVWVALGPSAPVFASR